MKLVVDTNVLFSYFNKKSKTIELLTNQNMQLFSPKYTIKELKKYKEDIKKKFSISEKSFKEILRDLNNVINFIDEEDYRKETSKINEITIDEKDKDFLALSIKLDCPLWSNDKLLKLQEKSTVLNTFEVAELIL
ncbi:MAG: PIN domain-containing protein [Candidatus Pacearchaeota archaeon]|nr:PIN domain-containing protein [Candidatus Pacearchaeota archaeon]